MHAKLRDLISSVVSNDVVVDVIPASKEAFGHYSTTVAMRLAHLRQGSGGQAKTVRRDPMELAKEICERIRKVAPPGLLEKVEAAPPGFINFWITKEALQKEFAVIAGDAKYGFSDGMKGKTVMVEYTDPNPFKLFHIGHLMTNTIGEAIARLHEAVGAKVIRANYQGDIGLHVAMSLWAMQRDRQNLPPDSASLAEKVAYLGKAYATGSTAYRGFDKLTTGSEKEPNSAKADLSAEAPQGGAKAEIEAVNEKVYARSDRELNRLYDIGKKWSLEYFEELYARLGTKFDEYFFESEIANEGRDLVLKYKDVFTESDGAIIFRGDEHGLHTRVFINSKGLPTYEAKELGLNKKKFELYPLDLSIIVTGNEINEYFKVLIKAMEFVVPEAAKKTRHIGHGMLRLPSGKMSSRTGSVITAESLLDQIKTKLRGREGAMSGMSDAEREAALEQITIGSIKYSILKQSPGQDIVFDFDKSLSLEGDSGPYLQYAYVRLKSILRKAGVEDREKRTEDSSFQFLDSEKELALMRKLFDFPVVVGFSAETLSTSYLATYLIELAAAANQYYETTIILKDENEARLNARLALVETVAGALQRGLHLLAIKTPERM
jgi:arginyl-tRNA synthetase